MRTYLVHQTQEYETLENCEEILRSPSQQPFVHAIAVGASPK